MPTGILGADINFPTLRDQNVSTQEKLDQIESYLYMLLENLRYSMGNLGAENFNETELANIANLITEPVYIQLNDTANGLTAMLNVTAQGLSSRVESVEGNVTSLQQTDTLLAARLTSAEGNITSLTATADGLSARVSNAEGAITQVAVTVNGFTVTDAAGTTRVAGSSIDTSTLYVSDLYGQIVNLRDSAKVVRGYLTINDATTTTNGAVHLDALGAMRFVANTGHVFISSATGGDLQLGDGICKFGNGALVLSSNNWGYTLPSTGTQGQVFFLLS